jgi:hypothetical protein
MANWNWILQRAIDFTGMTSAASVVTLLCLCPVPCACACWLVGDPEPLGQEPWQAGDELLIAPP